MAPDRGCWRFLPPCLQVRMLTEGGARQVREGESGPPGRELQPLKVSCYRGDLPFPPFFSGLMVLNLCWMVAENYFKRGEK